MDHVHLDATVTDARVGRAIDTFPSMARRVRALARGLRDRYSLKPGSTVVALAFNTVEHLELLLAVPLTGAALESLNPRALRTLADNTTPRPDLVAVDREMLYHPAVGEAARAVLAGMIADNVPVMTLYGEDLPGTRRGEILSQGLSDSTPLPALAEDTTAYIFHTSGTTGQPKAYPVSHRQAMLHALSQATVDASGLSHIDRVLPVAPFFHVNGWGLPLVSTLAGASLILPGSDVSPGHLIDLLAEEAVTVAAAVPTVWHDVCVQLSNHPARSFPALREVLSGGSPIPPSVASAAETYLGAPIAGAWGMTETMACSTYERHDPVRSAGLPIPLVELRVDQPLDRRGPDNQRGRLLVRGPFVIGQADQEEGWFATGDIATVDSGGALHLHDREKDLIKSGGEWIVSAELERILSAPCWRLFRRRGR